MDFMADFKMRIVAKVTENISSLGRTVSNGKVVVIKRNRDLKKGDIEVRLPHTGAAGHASEGVPWENIIKDIESIEMVHKVVQDNRTLFLKLHRDKIFQSYITEALNAGVRYGARELGKQCTVALNSVCDGKGDNISLNQLRNYLLSEHVKNTLRAKGYHVLCHLNSDPVVFRKTCELLEISVKEAASVQPTGNEGPNCVKYFQYLSLSQWKNEDEEPKTSESEAEVCLDLKRFIEHTGLQCGKGAYDKNIQFLKLSPDSDILKQAVRILGELDGKDIDMMIHLVPNKYEVSQQKMDLLSRIIESESSKNTTKGEVSSGQGSGDKDEISSTLGTSEDMSLPATGNAPIHHVHHVHRGVECQGFQNEAGGKTMPSAGDYLKQRLVETREAFSLKYGDKVRGPEWEQTIHQVTMADVTFEILSTNSSSPVKLDLHSVDLSEEDRRRASPGVFVMYNCARLAMLFTHFQQQVASGHYPDIPDISSIDFTTLREEEEWALLYNYILTYPDVIKATVEGLEPGRVKANIATHKVAPFLLELARDLSSYYSRVHVLVEPKPQLLPTMHARLVLLKAVQQVMHNALSLLGLTPLAQL